MPILRVTESSCLQCKLVSPIHYNSAHLSFGQCYEKNFQIFYRFCKYITFSTKILWFLFHYQFFSFLLTNFLSKIRKSNHKDETKKCEVDYLNNQQSLIWLIKTKNMPFQSFKSKRKLIFYSMPFYYICLLPFMPFTIYAFYHVCLFPHMPFPMASMVSTLACHSGTPGSIPGLNKKHFFSLKIEDNLSKYFVGSYNNNYILLVFGQ